MKNKLLVSVFALATAAVAFTSCETKSDVTDVCSGMIKESIHKSARSLLLQEGEALTIQEYEFMGGVDDNRLLFRTMSFGNGVYAPKSVDTMTYEYGQWQDNNTAFTLLVHPSAAPDYTLLFKGNALITPEGHVIGGEGMNNTARVEKWEKTLASFPNTKWKAAFRSEFIMDSVFRDSIRTTFIPPMTFKTDTIKIFTGTYDTISADTACYFSIELKRDPATLATTGHFYQRSVRSTYDRETKKETIVSETLKEYDCTWFFSEVSSDAKFVIALKSLDPKFEGEKLSISKYKTNDSGEAAEFLLGGLTYTRDMNP